MLNSLRKIRAVLYRFKRNFGLPVTLYKPYKNVHSLTTGTIDRTYTEKHITRAIVSPAKSIRTFLYDLTYIAANKNFTYGFHFDVSTRVVIIDSHDLDDFEINLNCHIEFNKKRYEIKAIDHTEDGNATLLIVTHLSNSRTASES